MLDERTFSWVDKQTGRARIVRLATMQDLSYKFQRGRCVEVRFSLNGSGYPTTDCHFSVTGRDALRLHDVRRNMIAHKWAYLGPSGLTDDEWAEFEITTKPDLYD